MKKVISYTLITIVILVTIVSILSIWDLIALEDVVWKTTRSLFVIFIASVVVLFISSVIMNNSNSKNTRDN